MYTFIRGLLIGLAIAAPVGPIGVLCIRRTLAEGRLTGLVSGLGAATADAIYGIIAGFGLTFISGILIAQKSWFSLIGGIFLCILGVRTFISKPRGVDDHNDSIGLAGSYLSVFILTLTNPVTILSFAAIFSGLGMAEENRGYTSALLVVSGVFIGSAAWWLFLSYGVDLFRKRVTTDWMRWINWISGSVLFIFGILALASLAG